MHVQTTLKFVVWYIGINLTEEHHSSSVSIVQEKTQYLATRFSETSVHLRQYKEFYTPKFSFTYSKALTEIALPHI